MSIMQKLADVAGMLMKKPPKIYNPSNYPISGAIKKFNEVYRQEGLGGVYNKARMESQFRVGFLVGTDANGNKYYENPDSPYTRTRWVEYPTPTGTWAIEDRYDGTMVHPEWYGWLHYMHDKPGPQSAKEYTKPFKQIHRIAQTMERPEYLDSATMMPREKNIHMPPGQWAQPKPRGKIGNKYESWYTPESGAPKLRNYADNAKTLHIE